MEASRSLVPEVTARTLRARVKNKPATLFLTALAFLADGTLSIRAQQQSEIDQPKSQVQGMERTLAEMKQKMAELERQKAGVPADPPTPWRGSRSIKDMEKVAEGGTLGEPPLDGKKTKPVKKQSRQAVFEAVLGHFPSPTSGRYLYW